MCKQRPDERGFVLLVVLWSVVLLALLCTQLVSAAGTAALMASNIKLSAELEAAADAGLHEAIFRMLGRSGQHWRADGQWRRLRSPHGEVAVSLESLDGKINPNGAMADLLSALFRQAGLPGAEAYRLAVKVQEWRVPGRWPRTMPVQVAEYRDAGRDHAPSGAPFQNLDELRNVLGMTPGLFAAVAPHLSLHTQDDPDRTVAGPVVLQAMLEAAGPHGYDSPGHGRDHAVLIRVVASGRGDARFVRGAVVLVHPNAERPWRVVALQDNWETDQAAGPVSVAALP